MTACCIEVSPTRFRNELRVENVMPLRDRGLAEAVDFAG
jgi:hypothetical protein